jgi:hypothetical protein
VSNREGPQDPSQEHLERIVGLARGPKGDPGEPGMTRGARLGFVYLSTVMLLLAAANLVFTSIQVGAANTKVQVQCRFDADLGSAPVAVNPKTGKASLLGVTIVSDGRVAWRQLGCAGHLAPPAPSFTHWARYYKLPIN